MKNVFWVKGKGISKNVPFLEVGGAQPSHIASNYVSLWNKIQGNLTLREIYMRVPLDVARPIFEANV